MGLITLFVYFQP